MWPPKRPSLEGTLPHCQAVTTNRKDLKLSFTEGRNPFWVMWGKEQQLGYLQQRCTPWFLRAPRLENLRWSDGKVATFHMAFVCHVLFCQHLHATRLWRGSGCGTIHRTPMSSQLNSEWLTDRERFGYLVLVLGSSVENLMSGWCMDVALLYPYAQGVAQVCKIH